MFYQDREVPADWQRELERIVPRTARIPWLKIVWQPGMTYEPVQRWEIYEMQPNLQYVEFDVRQALKGRSPREDGEWVIDRRIPEHLGGKRWITSSFVSTVQWQLYQETECFPLRFWIIQGTRGGHKWKLSAAEKSFIQYLRGRPRIELEESSIEQQDDGEIDTPCSGDLPYAEWDNRVRDKIIECDKLRTWKLSKPWDGRQENKTDAGLFVKRDRKADEERFAAAMLHYLESQVGDVVSDIPRSLLPSLPLIDRVGGDEDALDEQLITDTATSLETD